jgi:hypothetical protein
MFDVLNFHIAQQWSEFNFVTAILVFVVYIFIDALYSGYTLSVAGHKPYAAATMGSLIYFFTALGVISYTQNYLYIIPIAAGSWIGTFAVVYNARRHSIKKNNQK